MSQKHSAHGTFHITTNTDNKIPWCTWPGAPEIIIQNLLLTKKLHKAFLYAFCILPNHIHCIVYPGEKGISTFMQSFKSNTVKNVRSHYTSELGRGVPATGNIAPLTNVENIRWQNGFHDELLQNSKQRTNAMRYVTNNPLKHKLVKDIQDWKWTSLHFTELLDPLDIWFV